MKWPSAKGVFEATIDRAKQTITWRLTFSGASSHVFAAHIHGGGRHTESQRSTLLLELCGDPGVSGTAHRCVSGVHATYGQEDGLYPDTIRQILKAGFVNIHTRKNSDGEARGQLVIVK